MQIDHDPRELSHKALKIVALVTLVVTVGIAIAVAMTMNWAFHEIPFELVMLFDGLIAGLCIGFLVGRWDTRRIYRTPEMEG